MASPAVVYSRDLPGGGFVLIDAVLPAEGSPDHRARLVVERRAEAGRRAGHLPPVIAQSSGRDAESAADALRAIASDNVQLALAMRRWAQARLLAS
jgi:hypothetical protein